jgi:hypothetical protein
MARKILMGCMMERPHEKLTRLAIYTNALQGKQDANLQTDYREKR